MERYSRIVRALIRLLAVALVWSGCALPPQPSRTVVGTRVEGGVERPFSTLDELMTAGLVSEAMDLVEKNRFFDAERSLRQARYLEPENEQLAFNLGVVLNQAGQPEEALEILEGLYSRNPQQAHYAVALSDVLITRGRRDKARELLKGLFVRFKEAKNDTQAARIARSISNVSFEAGYEEESLCYSYEAFTLVQSAEQLGMHGRLLVALNLYSSSVATIEKAIKKNVALASSASVQHALALSRFGLGDLGGSLAAEESALDFVNKEPALGLELNTVWWLLKQQRLRDNEQDVRERLESMKEDVRDFVKVGGIAISTWPPRLRELIHNVASPQAD